MIITVTPNPSIDRTAVLAGPLRRGEVQRLEAVGVEAAGKGVNISRAAQLAATATLAIVPVAVEDPYYADLAAQGIPLLAVPPAGPVRINLAVTEPDGTTTKLNSPGSPITSADSARLQAAVAQAVAGASPGDWLVLAGSVPPGSPPDFYAQLVQSAKGRGIRIAVDTSDQQLISLVAALPAAAPDLMKPNDSELASLTGADPQLLSTDTDAAWAAARGLCERGVETVLVTLGGAGALLVTASQAWRAKAPLVEVASTVGAGDSSLFGYIYAQSAGLTPPECLAFAVAYGSAAAALPGTTIPAPHQVDPGMVQVELLGTASRGHHPIPQPDPDLPGR